VRRNVVVFVDCENAHLISPCRDSFAVMTLITRARRNSKSNLPGVPRFFPAAKTEMRLHRAVVLFPAREQLG
jgi:hypothetical protein